METALKEKVSPEKVREMVARGCTFQELVDTFEDPRGVKVSPEKVRGMVARGCTFQELVDTFEEQKGQEEDPRGQKAKIHYGESGETYKLLYGYSCEDEEYKFATFFDTKEEAIVDLAYHIAFTNGDTTSPGGLCTKTPVNENRKKMYESYAVDIFKDGDVYKYSIGTHYKYGPGGYFNSETDKEDPPNVVSSIPDEFLFSDIEKKVVTVGRKCLMCREENEIEIQTPSNGPPILNLYPNHCSDKKIYHEKEWGIPHKLCIDKYIENIEHAKETALGIKDNNLLSIVEADILTLKNGPEIFEKRLDIGYDFEKYVYQVGQLTKEANESGVFPGKAFVVAAFDPKKKEFEQVYRLNVNCENEKVFTETAKFVSRNTDMRQPLGETMTDEFIEKIEKFAKKQEKAVGKKQPAKTL